SDNEIIAWCLEIAKGMLYLHNQHIAHRDLKVTISIVWMKTNCHLKCENILVEFVGYSKVNRVVIADFGVAICLDECIPEERIKEMQRIAGTPGFIAPEILNQICEDLYK